MPNLKGVGNGVSQHIAYIGGENRRKKMRRIIWYNKGVRIDGYGLVSIWIILDCVFYWLLCLVEGKIIEDRCRYYN